MCISKKELNKKNTLPLSMCNLSAANINILFMLFLQLVNILHKERPKFATLR